MNIEKQKEDELKKKKQFRESLINATTIKKMKYDPGIQVEIL